MTDEKQTILSFPASFSMIAHDRREDVLIMKAILHIHHCFYSHIHGWRENIFSHDFTWFQMKNRKHWIRWPSIKENHFLLHSTHQHKAHLIIMTYEHLLLSTSFSSVISHEDRTFVMQHCRQWSISNIHIWIL